MFLYALISPGTSATKEKPINRELKPRANNKNVAKKRAFLAQLMK